MSSLRSPKNDLEMFKGMLLDRRAEVVRQTRREEDADRELRKERQAISKELEEVNSSLRRHSPAAKQPRAGRDRKLSPRSRTEKEEFERKREFAGEGGGGGGGGAYAWVEERD